MECAKNVFAIFIWAYYLRLLSSAYFSEPKWWKLIQHNYKSNDFGAILSPQIRSDLNLKQLKMIKRQPEIMPVILESLKMASDECKFQFRKRQWNCTFQEKFNQPVFGPVSQRGCRETAFLYAVISAAITENVAKACSKHKLKYCSCDSQYVGPSGFDWEWSGCSDNLRYAQRFAKKFTGAAEIGQDLRAAVNRHNNDVGVRTVLSLATKKCRCHGVSASCSQKICWKTAPRLNSVGGKLYGQFKTAVKVTADNSAEPYRQKRTRNYRSELTEENVSTADVRKKELIYFEDSPNMCAERPDLIRNRLCNKSSLLTDGCELMCCKGLHRTATKTVTVQCRCRFIYCCKVECDKCSSQVEISYCV